MSNLGITISFVIGGLLIVSIITLNGRVIRNSGETVLNMTAKQTTKNINDLMRYDFQRLGYNMDSAIDDAIQSYDGKSITFYSDLDNDASSKANTITWEFTDQEHTVTKNPNDFKLIRTGPIDGTVQTTTFPVTYDDYSQANFVYLDTDGDTLSPGSDPASLIRSIAVRVQTQSPVSYDGNDYSISFWNKTFAPAHLNLKDVFGNNN